MKPNKEQWAEVATEAALNYSDVLNGAMVIFDAATGEFSWESNLNPISVQEVIVNTDIRWEYYFQDGIKPNVEEMYSHFTEDSVWWEAIVKTIVPIYFNCKDIRL